MRHNGQKKYTIVACLAIGFITAPFAFAQAKRASPAETNPPEPWHFAVSGDSRNCGDVVMPAIAERVRADGAMFYWHLGDYRAIYDFDQDIKARIPSLSVLSYENTAWPDFIQRQLRPFGDLPVYLALGNHETIPPKTHTDVLLQFADWYEAPEIVKQRLADDPSNHQLQAYYHWIRGGVDFITLDNSTELAIYVDSLLLTRRSLIPFQSPRPFPTPARI